MSCITQHIGFATVHSCQHINAGGSLQPTWIERVGADGSSTAPSIAGEQVGCAPPKVLDLNNLNNAGGIDISIMIKEVAVFEFNTEIEVDDREGGGVQSCQCLVRLGWIAV